MVTGTEIEGKSFIGDTYCFDSRLKGDSSHNEKIYIYISVTLDYEHNLFQENARNPKHSHIKASFPIEVNGNENNLFRIDFNRMQYCMRPEVGGHQRASERARKARGHVG